MKTITVKQPWASLMFIGESCKDVENRTWKTSVRGRVLIHAASNPVSFHNPNQIFTQEQYDAIPDKIQSFCTKNSVIIGSVEIVDCVINHDSIWAEKTIGGEKPTYNWILANPILFDKPIPAKGKLSFWDFNMESINK